MFLLNLNISQANDRNRTCYWRLFYSCILSRLPCNEQYLKQDRAFIILYFFFCFQFITTANLKQIKQSRDYLQRHGHVFSPSGWFCNQCNVLSFYTVNECRTKKAIIYVYFYICIKQQVFTTFYVAEAKRQLNALDWSDSSPLFFLACCVWTGLGISIREKLESQKANSSYCALSLENPQCSVT